MPLPIISVAQMREWEKATWASGQTEAFVIEQAGAVVVVRGQGAVLLWCVVRRQGDDDGEQPS